MSKDNKTVLQEAFKETQTGKPAAPTYPEGADPSKASYTANQGAAIANKKNPKGINPKGIVKKGQPGKTRAQIDSANRAYFAAKKKQRQQAATKAKIAANRKKG